MSNSSTLNSVKGIIQGKCPKCKEGQIFAYSGNIFKVKAPVMHEKCPVCTYKFEKEPGYFLGSMYVSYALAVAELMVVFISLIYFVDIYLILMIMLLVLLLLSFLNFRYARIVWIYIFQI